MIPRRQILPIFVPHAGCPNDCVFCDQKRISGSLFPVSPRTVAERLEAVPPGAGWELAFYGGSFTAIPEDEQERLLSAADPARASGRIASVRVSTRPDAIDAAVMERLRRHGVKTVELGVQSMDETVLRRCGRGHTVADTARAVEQLLDGGFSLVLQMMTGLPGSSPEKDLMTARAIAAFRPHAVRIYPTVILRGTRLEDLWRSGLYREHTVEEAVRVCAEILPVFDTAGISVIRLGLNPTRELSEGAVAGGAYHPALGDLVRSRMWRSRAEKLLMDVPPGSRVVLGVDPRRVSFMTGQHRCNIRYLEEAFSLSSLRVRAAEEAGEEILLLES